MSTETAEKILIEWVVSPSSQNSENMASRSHETNRIPDPYVFVVKDEKIRSPSNNLPIENQILRRDTLEELEFQAFLKIQDWANSNNEGMILWFSPPSEYGYSALKVVSTKILNLLGQKILFNRAIVIDGVNEEESINFANSLSPEKFYDTETLRYTPIPLDKNSEEKWLDTLSKYTPQVELIRTSQDVEIKTNTLLVTEKIVYSSPIEAEKQAREQNLIGDKKDSCQRNNSGSAFNVMSNGVDSDKFFECPKCHGLIPSGFGITTCPHCGLTKEEAGSLCV